MKKQIRSITYQQGAATLFTAVILLISITLVAFLTAKNVLVSIQMNANNYRTEQAIAAANAAMDYALSYFGTPGNTTFPCVTANYPANFTQNHTYTAGTNLPTTTASVCIDNTTTRPLTTPWGATVTTSCVTNSGSTTAGMIIATGWSDDGSAQRTISQCVGTRSLMAGNGPDQTLVSGGSVGLTGSAQIINRFNDLNVWSAGAVDIGSGAMETYIRPTDMEINDLSFSQLTSTATSPSIPNVQKVSSQGLGTGTDIYHNDGVLTSAITATQADIANGGEGDGPNTFFDMFFPDIRKAELARSAEGTTTTVGGTAKPHFLEGDADSGDLTGLKGGIIYVDGDASFGGNVSIGSATEPVLLFVNGNFDLTGGQIFGVVYITGELTGAGNPEVSGSLITEAGVDRGAGTVTLVYMPFGDGSGNGPILPGLTGVIAGSWRDW